MKTFSIIFVSLLAVIAVIIFFSKTDKSKKPDESNDTKTILVKPAFAVDSTTPQEVYPGVSPGVSTGGVFPYISDANIKFDPTFGRNIIQQFQ
jgi:hypothetical protein